MYAFVTNYDDSNVSVIDIGTNKVINTFAVGTLPEGIAVLSPPAPAPAPVPGLTPIGLIALVGLVSIVIAMSINIRKKRG